MSSAWLTSTTIPIPVPSPKSAVRIGSPIASSEPKLRSSTATAATRPTTMVEPIAVRCTCSIAGPASSTWSAGERPDAAIAITRWVVPFARLSSTTVANPIEPSRETAPAPGANGLDTEETCGSASIRARSAATVRRISGSASLPERAWKTIWSRSPDCCGKPAASSSRACWEPVCGSWKSLT